jgi:hypothetical protein
MKQGKINKRKEGNNVVIVMLFEHSCMSSENWDLSSRYCNLYPREFNKYGRTAANWLQISCSGTEAYEQVNRWHANRFQ